MRYPASGYAPGAPARGFTLLEVLVVVAIGAIMVGVVVLRMGDWRTEMSPDRQLERLAALIEAQCDQAMFQSRPRGIRITEEGYDFWQSASDGWVVLSGEGINRPRHWQGGLEPSLDVTGYRARLDEEPELPQLWCDPLGELSLFTLTLEGGGLRASLSADRPGRLRVEAGR
ncbi:prepilin-type N-terminal cleavage/methylation domain-containing protein [Wenzhouxiangella sp. AB-CW3]|uniref:prepilin-type N-terminal cleavage/methylation domain-containing protein n=1 Tax=Wenzhouxiangella sp. AB-CW3 TaxID=2771012 RepID=UPI00168AE515|nr:prepilin-type N-terminal cleavage/methylation domain-containing protein [Wenzhouxiangella sp. AB-CW3]QOC23136.1 prepilin-type N-terminal cleavage/methylation domain-containing protein [Wenzhouxiangella sp. AB-CW3]